MRAKQRGLGGELRRGWRSVSCASLLAERLWRRALLSRLRRLWLRLLLLWRRRQRRLRWRTRASGALPLALLPPLRREPLSRLARVVLAISVQRGKLAPGTARHHPGLVVLHFILYPYLLTAALTSGPTIRLRRPSYPVGNWSRSDSGLPRQLGRETELFFGRGIRRRRASRRGGGRTAEWWSA